MRLPKFGSDGFVYVNPDHVVSLEADGDGTRLTDVTDHGGASFRRIAGTPDEVARALAEAGPGVSTAAFSRPAAGVRVETNLAREDVAPRMPCTCPDVEAHETVAALAAAVGARAPKKPDERRARFEAIEAVAANIDAGWSFLACGPRVTIWPKARIVRPQNVTAAGDLMVDDFAFVDAGIGTAFGRFVHISSGVTICGGGTLDVGPFVTISSGAVVYTGTDDVLEGLAGATIPPRHRSVLRCVTTIGPHVHIMANAVVHAGVVIPAGVVVAPGAVVTEKAADRMLPWGVYGGAPALRLIRMRPENLVRSRAEALMRELPA